MLFRYLIVNMPRRMHTHRQSFKTDCLKLATGIANAYGPSYAPAITYLNSLAENKFWTEATLPPLPWHERDGDPRIGEPIYNLHQSVVDCFAPSFPLKAIFSGLRR